VRSKDSDTKSTYAEQHAIANGSEDLQLEADSGHGTDARISAHRVRIHARHHISWRRGVKTQSEQEEREPVAYSTHA